MDKQKGVRPRSTMEPVPPLDEDLHWCLVRLVRGLGAAEVAAVAECGVSLRGYTVLTALAVDGGAESQLALARSTAMDKSTLVRVLDELEEKRYVIRVTDPNDRRVRTVEISRQGRIVRQRAGARIAEVEEEILGLLTPTQRKAFRAFARALGTGPAAATFDTKPAAV